MGSIIYVGAGGRTYAPVSESWPDDWDECPVCGALSFRIATGRCVNGCTDAPADLGPLAVWVLDRTAPGLWAETLPDEDAADTAARLAAARDITRELLAEFAAGFDELAEVAA